MQVKKLDINTLSALNKWTVARINPGQRQESGSYTLLPAVESENLRASYNTSLIAAITNNTLIEVNDDTYDNRSFAYTIVLATDDPPPKPLLSLFQRREPHPNADFAKRQAAGEIVVSNFLRAAIRVTSEAALFHKPIANRESLSFPLDKFVQGTRFYGTRFFITNELFLTSSSQRIVSGQYKLFERGYLPPLAVTAREVFDQMVSNDIDTGLVGRTLADINKGTLDVLTAMAEMPKLLESIFRGISLMADLLKAAKRREIDLSAAHKRRLKGNQQSYENAIARLAERKKQRRPGQKHLSSKVFNNLREKERNRLNRANKEASLEFLDAVSSVWLNFRYNISPTVYLINDLEDTLAFKRTFLTRRNGFGSTGQVIVGGEVHSYDRNSRIFIKRRIQSTGSLNTASANFAVTAWELVPLSFVIDWFINIGDLIASFTVASSFSEQGSTWAERKVISSVVTNPSGQRVTIEGYIYNRKVIDPIQLTCLDFKWDMNAYRYLDSLALLWGPIRNKLITNASGLNKPSGKGRTK